VPVIINDGQHVDTNQKKVCRISPAAFQICKADGELIPIDTVLDILADLELGQVDNVLTVYTP
jgi:hypothetical protein